MSDAAPSRVARGGRARHDNVARLRRGRQAAAASALYRPRQRGFESRAHSPGGPAM